MIATPYQHGHEVVHRDRLDKTRNDSPLCVIQLAFLPLNTTNGSYNLALVIVLAKRRNICRSCLPSTEGSGDLGTDFPLVRAQLAETMTAHPCAIWLIIDETMTQAEQGDFGLGPFNDLDGEIVMFDGRVRPVGPRGPRCDRDHGRLLHALLHGIVERARPASQHGKCTPTRLRNYTRDTMIEDQARYELRINMKWRNR